MSHSHSGTQGGVNTASSSAEPAPPAPQKPDESASIDYPIHIPCSSCKHFHRHTRFQISKNPEIGKRFHCEKCEKPLFQIGRSSTQVTVASGESREANLFRFSIPPPKVCTNLLRRGSRPRFESPLSLPPQEPSEPAQSRPLTPEGSRAAASMAADKPRRRIILFGNRTTASNDESKKTIRRTLLEHLSTITRSPQKIFRTRLQRWKSGRSHDMQAGKSGPKDSDEPQLRMSESPTLSEPPTQSPEAKSKVSQPASAGQGCEGASQKLDDAGNRSQNPSVPHLACQQTAGGPDTESSPKDEPLKAHRERRTIIAGKVVVVRCDCSNKCPCKCEGHCSGASTRTSNPSSINGKDTIEPSRNIPEFFNAGSGVPEVLAGVNNVFGQSLGQGGDQSNNIRLSQVSTQAGSHEGRAPSIDASTMSATTQSPYRHSVDRQLESWNEPRGSHFENVESLRHHHLSGLEPELSTSHDDANTVIPDTASVSDDEMSRHRNI